VTLLAASMPAMEYLSELLEVASLLNSQRGKQCNPGNCSHPMHPLPSDSNRQQYGCFMCARSFAKAT
jgi:hypothetical protein